MDIEELMRQYMAGPSEADRSAARQQALMAAGLGILSAPIGRRGNVLNALGQGGLLGMNTYQQAMGEAGRRGRRGMQDMSALMGMQGQQLDLKTKQAALDEMERQRQEAAMARDVLRGFRMPAPLPSMSPTNENAARLAATPKAGLFEKLNAQADALEAKGLVQQAQQYRTLAEKYAPQYEGMETVMRDGKPVVLQRFKNRAPEETGYMPKPDYKQVDTGGQIGFYDPLTGQAGGQFAKTATPGDLLSATVAREGQGVTMRGQNMTDARAREQAEIARKQLEAGGKPTDQQLSAQSFLSRMENASSVIDKLERGGYAPGVMGALAQGVGKVPLIGGVASMATVGAGNALVPEWPQYRQAQEEWVRAKLRKESGAVISDSEMEGEIRTYFPQPGDPASLRKQKAMSRQATERAIAQQAGGVRAPKTSGIGTSSTAGKIGGMSDDDLRKALGL